MHFARFTWPPLRWSTWVVLILGMVGTLPLQAQTPNSAPADDDDETYTFAVRSVPLEEALQQLVEQTAIDLAYSTDVVEGRTVYCRKRDAAPDEILQCILDGTGVDYLQTARGSYLLVKSPQLQPAGARIAGQVRDAETGEPLPRANVFLADASTGTTTDEAGQFSFSGVLPGDHRLVVTHVGYGTAVDSVEASPGERASVNVPMNREVIKGSPVIIDGLQRRLPSGGLGEEQLDGDRLMRLTEQGTPDVLHSASQQVGITLNRPLAEINIQGGDSGEHVMRLDGAPVRQPLSLGGLLSAFSPHALDRVTVHKAGFGVQQGSYTAGVLDARNDLSRADMQLGTGSVDPIGANVRASGTWRAESSGTGHVMAAARSSLWEVYEAPALRQMLDLRTMVDPTLAPWWMDALVAADDGENSLADEPLAEAQVSHLQFADVHGAVRQELTPFQQVYVSAYHGRTRLGTDLARLQSANDEGHHMEAQDEYDWTNTALQARHEWQAGGRVTGTLQLYGSWHEADTHYGMREAAAPLTASADVRPPDDRITDTHATDGNRIEEWGARAELEASLSPTVRLRTGLEPQHVQGRFRVVNQFLGDLSYATQTWQLGSYAEAEITPGHNLTASVGTRLTYLPARQTAYAEPRLTLRYDDSTALGNVAARLAGGLYRQYTMQSEVSMAGPTSIVPSAQFWLPLDASLGPPRAYHTAADLLVEPADRWSLRLESYYKVQPRTLEFDYAGLVADHSDQATAALPARSFDRQEEFVAAGEGRAYGLAAQVQRQGQRLTGRVGLELNRTERRYPDRFEERFVPAPWEQPVHLATGLDVRITEGVQLQSNWEGIWGRSWAFRRAYYDYLQPLGADAELDGVDLGDPGSHTLDPFYRLDLGVRTDITLRGVSLEAEVNLINVFDRANASDRSLALGGGAPQTMERGLPGRRLFVLLALQY